MMSKTDTYMFVMLDLDVPPAANSNQRRVLLHCMNTGFKASNQEIGGAATLLSSSDTGPAAYIPPNPPAVDTIAHRYVELLFQQPANFSIAQSTFAEMSARINFDTQAFMTQHGLKAPVAANFFLVDGRTNSTAAANPTGTGSGGISAISNGDNFQDEINSRLKFNRRGLLGMANEGKDTNASQFFFTLGATPELQGKNTMFGRIEGDTIFNLVKMADAELTDGSERPMYPTKITGSEIILNCCILSVPTFGLDVTLRAQTPTSELWTSVPRTMVTNAIHTPKHL